MPDNRRSVDDDYARAFEDGALAALDHVTDLRPDLEDVTMVAAERIGRDVDAMGRADTTEVERLREAMEKVVTAPKGLVADVYRNVLREALDGR